MKRAAVLSAAVIIFSVMSGCVPDNGTASYDPITDAQYQEALKDEQNR